MGSILYDYLSESLLFHEKQVTTLYSAVSDADLAKECERYREFCLQNFSELAADLLKQPLTLRAYCGVETTSVDVLKQSAFYVEQFVLCDPMFEAVRQPHAVSDVMREYLGFPNEPPNRRNIASAANKLRELAPMVSSNFVKILPTSYFHEPPDQIPLLHSDNNYIEGIPESLLSFFHQRAVVSSLERVEHGYVSRGQLYPCRTISVEFGGNRRGDTMMFQLYDNEIFNTRQERSVEFRMSLPESPPDKNLFDTWVKQSINRAAKHCLHTASQEIQLATRFESTLFTNSPLAADLLQHVYGMPQDISTYTANSLLKFDLPFLDKVDVQTLMTIRQDDGESFQRFRSELERHFRELRLIHDPETLQKKVENVWHELSECQVRQVETTITNLKRKSVVDAAIMIGGLATTIQTGGWSLLASAIAAARGYKTMQEYLQNAKQNPAFFLWRVIDL